MFVADTGNNAVKEIVAAGGYTIVRTLGSGFNVPISVAVDGGGNVFVADTGNNAVKEIVAAGGYTTVHTLGSGFNIPHAVAVDGRGNVFVADTGQLPRGDAGLCRSAEAEASPRLTSTTPAAIARSRSRLQTSVTLRSRRMRPA